MVTHWFNMFFTIHVKNFFSFLNKVTENDRLIVFEILFSSVYYKFVTNCIKQLITFLYFKISQAMQHDRLIVFEILFPLVYDKFVANCIKHLNTFLYFKISQAKSCAISFLPVSDCKPTSVRVCWTTAGNGRIAANYQSCLHLFPISISFNLATCELTSGWNHNFPRGDILRDLIGHFQKWYLKYETIFDITKG